MVTYTSSSLYWSPLRPRIRIYAFNDTNYAAPLYSYNPFTDVGTTTKPIGLNFDSQTANVGTFSVEIEDQNYELDADLLLKGNRVFIDCSKDGVTWQPAFKGLVRGSDQEMYAESGRNLTLNGYSYLIRLNERVINTIKESSLTGDEYDRTDSTMFTNALINDLLTTDSHYVHSTDDTQLYSIFKKSNINSSPITEWIPRLDAQLVTLSDAINSVLEFSNGLVMLDPSNDELMLYSADMVTSATSIFLLTNHINRAADDADYTMYPLEPYRYNISYDYPDSGSRLIGSIGSGGEECEPADAIDPCQGVEPATGPNHIFWAAATNLTGWWAMAFKPCASHIKAIEVGGLYPHAGNISAMTKVFASVWSNSASEPDVQVSDDLELYVNGTPGTPFPTSSPGPGAAVFTVRQKQGTSAGSISGLNAAGEYFLVIKPEPGLQSDANILGWRATSDSTKLRILSQDSGSTWTGATGTGFTAPNAFKWSYSVVNDNPCGGGGSQATIDADPVFAVAHDRNMSNRLGIVERVISGIPTHIKTAQTLNEYLYNKLYFAAKPRFTFDFPSVSMPNKVPKAGDIVAHVDTKANVGTTSAPIQTGVISSVQYSFEQGSDEALGLRRLSLTTTGIKRGSY